MENTNGALVKFEEKNSKDTFWLIKESLKCVNDIEERIKSEIDEYNKAITQFEILKDDIVATTIDEFEKTLKELQNFETDLKTKEELNNINFEKKEFLESEKKVLKIPSFKTFSRFLKSLILFIVLFLIIFIYGINISGVGFENFETIKSNFNNIIITLGSLLPMSKGNELNIGYSILFGIPLVLSIIYWIASGIAINKKNYKKALELYSEAKEYEDSRIKEIESIKDDREKINKMYNNLNTLKVFLEEMIYRLKRILHLEGKDVKNFHEKSKKDLLDSIDIEEIIFEILEVSIDENKDSFEHILKKSENFLEEFKRKIYA